MSTPRGGPDGPSSDPGAEGPRDGGGGSALDAPTAAVGAERTRSAAPPSAYSPDATENGATRHSAPPPDEQRTQAIPRVEGDAPPGDGSSGSRRPLLIGAAVVGLLALLYVGDLVVSSTDVPRGVTVAGVEIGGMSKPEAEDALRSRLEPRLSEPVELRAGEATAQIDPREAGLEFDLTQTVERAGEQPLAPWTRVSSLFTTRDIPPATKVNAFTVARSLEGARRSLDRPVVEGTVRFEGTQPVPVPSRPGQRLDAQAGTQAVADHWLDPTPVEIPTAVTPVTVTPEGLQRAIDEIARPAVADKVTVVGTGVNATLSPEDIGRVLTFRPDGSGGLVGAVDEGAATRILEPQLASTESEGKDATYDFAGDAATVKPSVVGRQIDWPKTLAPLMDAVAQPPGQPAPPVYVPPPTPPGVDPPPPPPVTGRAINAVYNTKQPKVTTDQLKALGPATMIGEFQTGGFAPDSGQNIKRVAEQVNGAVVAPGETFSLNEFTGPRDAAKGYVDAGIIEDGLPARGIGGGISQFATTLYNASYFAGMEDVEHKEHSYYISRYPAGREATVFEGAIDLRFRNTGPTPVLIRTTWTPETIKVQLYGQKRYDVTSKTGERTNTVPFGTKDLSANPKCKPSKGVDGFTITDTRTLRDVKTGEVKNEPRTVRYEPEPQITCKNRGGD